MDVTMLMKTFSLIILLQMSGVSFGCVDLDSVTQDGKRMISAVFKMVDSVSLYTCVSHCLTVSTSMSVSYQRETRTCHLASQDSAGDPKDVHTDPEFFLTDISLWPRSLAGPCEGVTCEGGSRCVVDRFNTPGCVPGTESCFELDNTRALSLNTPTCMSDFLFCGTSSTHTCSSLGTIPFIGTMPCLMTEGFKVKFEGRPTRHRRVTMSVETTDFIIQADGRMDIYLAQDKFLLNKLLNGVWKTDVYVLSTLAVAVNFTCEIVRQNRKYEVYMDGTYAGYTEDGAPDIHPDSITVSEDVHMDRVTFSPA